MIVEADDLVTNADIATLAGVTRAAVTNWIARHDTFPKPVATVGNGKFKLFLRTQVIEWLSTPQTWTVVLPSRTITRTYLRKHSEDDTVYV